MRHDGSCKHGTLHAVECPHCDAEKLARDGTHTEHAETDQAKEHSFWGSERTQDAQRVLDVWASVRRAINMRALPPTMDAIFETPVPMHKPFFDHESGLMITDWCARYASSTGHVLTKTSSANLMGESVLVYFAVEEVLLWTGRANIYAAVLELSYPRTGPYQVNLTGIAAMPPQDTSRDERKWEKRMIWKIRNARIHVRKVTRTIEVDASDASTCIPKKEKGKGRLDAPMVTNRCAYVLWDEGRRGRL